MNFVIMDLEWNNSYGYKTRAFVNEIIEIGAVKLDENLDEFSSFSCFVKPQIGKKLRSNIKRLTHISNDDVRLGYLFNDAITEFEKFIGDEDTVILTWGDSDIRVLIENNKYINSKNEVAFLKKYIDIQKYFQIKKGISLSQQIGLFPAAEMSGLDPDSFSHHRALDDSLIAAQCLKNVFEDDFFDYVNVCDRKFYEKLDYKPRAISNIANPLVDKSVMNCTCQKCDIAAKQTSEWRYSNQYFRAFFKCPCCSQKYRVAVRFKKYYDRLDIKKNVTLVHDDEIVKK